MSLQVLFWHRGWFWLPHINWQPHVISRHKQHINYRIQWQNMRILLGREALCTFLGPACSYWSTSGSLNYRSLRVKAQSHWERLSSLALTCSGASLFAVVLLHIYFHIKSPVPVLSASFSCFLSLSSSSQLFVDLITASFAAPPFSNLLILSAELSDLTLICTVTPNLTSATTTGHDQTWAGRHPPTPTPPPSSHLSAWPRNPAPASFRVWPTASPQPQNLW